MDEVERDAIRASLAAIDPAIGYYALTMTVDVNGRTRWSTQTQWVGRGSKPMREIRVASMVKPAVMRDLWARVGQSSVCINSDRDVAVYMRIGGNALVQESIAQEWFPFMLEPTECVTSPLGVGPRPVSSLPPSLLNHAPTKKVRMDVLRRDDFRCRVCGRRAADDVDIVLNVHHIQPWGDGGPTEDHNLITLCHTCHMGLDPHFEPRLSGMLPGGYPSVEIDVDADRAEYEHGVAMYRARARGLLGESEGAPCIDSRLHVDES